MKKTLLFLTAFTYSLTNFAQVVYTDVDPDEVLTAASGNSATIDFDGDMNPELVIFADAVDTVITPLTVHIEGVALTTLGNTEVIGSSSVLGTETIIIADTLHQLHSIDGSAAYVNSSMPSVFPGVGLGVYSNTVGLGEGKFINNGELYFGVQFEITGATHYGWVRVSVADLAVSGILFDYAYESTANTAIQAGDMGSGNFVSVEEEQALDINIYNAGDQLVLKGNDLSGELSVINLIGKTLINQTVNQSQNIDLSELTAGIYLVNYTQGSQTVTKKILVD